LPGDRNLKFQRFSRISLPGVALQPEHLGPNQLHYAALGQTPVVIRFPSGSINDLFCCHGLFSSKIQDSCDRYSVTKNFAHHEHFARALAKLAVNGSVHLYEVRPRKDPRGVDLISDRCHSVGCGMPGQTQSATQSDTRSIAAAHMMP